MKKALVYICALCPCFLLMTGCAALPRQVRAEKETIPFREAFVQEGATDIGGIRVKAEIPDRKEQKRLFAYSLSGRGITPILFTLTNKSGQSIAIDPFSARTDKAVIALPLDTVFESLECSSTTVLIVMNIVSFGAVNISSGRRGIINRRQMKNEATSCSLHAKALHPAVIPNGGTVNGYIFFRATVGQRPDTVSMPAQALGRMQYLDLSTKITSGR